jgi:predicted ATPase
MGLQAYFAEASILRPAYLGGNNWHLANLHPITILFGKNSSGKSLLLRAWRDAYIESSHYVVPERTGALGFNPSYMQQQIDARQRRDLSIRNFVNEYRQQVIARVQTYFVARGATRAGELPGDPGELEKLISALLPDFAFELIGANPPYKLTRTENGQIVGDVDQLSSGEAQVLTVGLDILTMAAIWDIQKLPQRLMLVDEPDAHIHPDLQARFADFLVQVGRRFNLQIVVASHSTTLLAALGQFGAEEAAVIYVDRTKADFVAQPFTSALKELAACLGGHALMGPLFGVPLLLVEGDDDYRIWSQVPRHHITSFAVIPCHGEEIKKYQKSLERVLDSLREPSQPPTGYALLDGDMPLPQPNPDVPQDHVRFIRMNCREAENLYLCDETLALIGTRWNEASAKISAESGRFGNKAAKLTSAPQWDRRREDVKDVIDEVASILDGKNIHWTVRVGVAIGRSVPQGQLREFLGSDIVSALWRTG